MRVLETIVAPEGDEANLPEAIERAEYGELVETLNKVSVRAL
jgi:hypothetical protein